MLGDWKYIYLLKKWLQKKENKCVNIHTCGIVSMRLSIIYSDAQSSFAAPENTPSYFMLVCLEATPASSPKENPTRYCCDTFSLWIKVSLHQTITHTDVDVAALFFFFFSLERLSRSSCDLDK